MWASTAESAAALELAVILVSGDVPLGVPEQPQGPEPGSASASALESGMVSALVSGMASALDLPQERLSEPLPLAYAHPPH